MIRTSKAVREPYTSLRRYVPMTTATIGYDRPPIRLDTASVSGTEYVISAREVSRAAATEAELASTGEDSADSLAPDTDNRQDFEYHEPCSQILPYYGRSHLRDTASRAGHAWVNASLCEDPQVAEAKRLLNLLASKCNADGTAPALHAYSGGSVTGHGVAGSAAWRQRRRRPRCA